MSLKTLLQKIGEDISSIFSKTVNELETVILPAVTTVTNLLKTAIDSDTTDIVGKLAGAAGAALEDKVRAILDAGVPKLQLAQALLTSGADASTILAKIIVLVKASPAETQTAFWIEFSGMLAKDLVGGMTAGDAITLEQYFYKNYPAAQTGTAPADPAASSAPAPTTPPASN
jgi:hypothetical protein